MKKKVIWLSVIFAVIIILAAAFIIPQTRAGIAVYFYNLNLYPLSGALFSTLPEYENYEKSSIALNYLSNKKYLDAAIIFKELGDFKNSEIDYKYCMAKLYQYDSQYQKAMMIFSDLGKYRDSEICLAQSEIERKNIYERAIKYTKNENYYSALMLFEKLDNYLQSESYIIYNTALRDIISGEIDKGYDALISLEDFEDSAKIAKYCLARRMENSGEYSSAAKIYIETADFYDSAERHEICTDKYFEMNTYNEHTSYYGNMYDKARHEFANQIFELYSGDENIVKYYKSAYIASRSALIQSQTNSD